MVGYVVCDTAENPPQALHPPVTNDDHAGAVGFSLPHQGICGRSPNGEVVDCQVSAAQSVCYAPRDDFSFVCAGYDPRVASAPVDRGSAFVESGYYLKRCTQGHSQITGGFRCLLRCFAAVNANDYDSVHSFSPCLLKQPKIRFRRSTTDEDTHVDITPLPLRGAHGVDLCCPERREFDSFSTAP
jgi:hypothetical protein